MTLIYRPWLTIGIVLALATSAGLYGLRQHVWQSPAPVAFAAVAGRIPGETVRSQATVLQGFRGPLPARVKGDAVLLVNGKPAPDNASVRAGDRVALSVLAAPIGQVREAVLVVRDMRAPFRVESLKKQPSAELRFAPVTVPAGRTAFSSFVTAEGVVDGTVLSSPEEGLRIATRDGKLTLPTPLVSGQIFQLAAKAPDRAGETRSVAVELGGRSAVWLITAR
jgi:hypothetical protein